MFEMKSQSQPLRIESNRYFSFGTSKTSKAALWFVNNRKLEQNILAYLAKYQEKYNVTLYAFVMQGNHYHLLAKFNDCNRAAFYRDFNARIAELVRKFAPGFEEGALFSRRYSEQAIPLNEDVEERFFYCALQPVLAGLCKKISEYPGYNSCFDAIQEVERKFTVTDWAKFNSYKRFNKQVNIEDFQTVHTLKFSRLPGSESLSRKEYRNLLFSKLEEKRKSVVSRIKTFLGPEKLKRVRPGERPKKTKKSHRFSHRPLVLTGCRQAKKQFLEWYFATYASFKKATVKYLLGENGTAFPPRTYKPPLVMVPS